MKKEIRISVFREESCLYAFDGNIQEVLDWWNAKFKLIPEEYKHNAKVDANISDYYGVDKLEIEIYYYRLETDEEYDNRINQEIVRNQVIRDRELKQYEMLKAKYGK